MAETFLCMPIPLGRLSSAVFPGVGNVPFMNILFPPNFIMKNLCHLKNA